AEDVDWFLQCWPACFVVSLLLRFLHAWQAQESRRGQNLHVARPHDPAGPQALREGGEVQELGTIHVGKERTRGIGHEGSAEEVGLPGAATLGLVCDPKPPGVR